MTSSDWTDQSDPWLTQAMHRSQLLATIEDELLDAVVDAMRHYLAEARKAVLRTPTTRATADPKRDIPPILDGWPGNDLWQQLLHRLVLPAVREAYRRVMAELWPETDPEVTIAGFVDTITHAWKTWIWPDVVYEQAQDDLNTSQAHGDTIRQQRRVLDTVLRMSAPEPSIRERIAQLRREGHPVPQEMTSQLAPDEYAWHNQARIDTRWLSVVTANEATLDGGRAQQSETETALYKTWMATSDQRVRDAHWHADKQSVPLDEPFTVVGWPMSYPGDTSAPPELWVNCRCTITVNTRQEADELNDRRARELPNRTDVYGEPLIMTADAEPTADNYIETQEAAQGGTYSWSETVAAAAPEHPPAAWFSDPQLSGPTKIRVDDTGRVYGYLALWDTEHRGAPGVTPPVNASGTYPWFHRHSIRTAEGTRVFTGPLATGGHSALDASMSAAMQHYDDPSFVVADVVVGEDERGIWAAGSLRYGLSPFQVMVADRYSWSGDWRDDEMVAACSVSVPGFHVPDDPTVIAMTASAQAEHCLVLSEETQARSRADDDGHVTALVAAGIVPPAGQQGAPEPASQVDLTRLGFEVYRKAQEAEATDKALQASARRILEPRVQALHERVLGSRDGN